MGETGLGFVKRDVGAKQEEDKGIIDFRLYTNDGTVESLRLLIDLKNIVSKQLPKMPKEYITRLMLDRNHSSMMIVKKTPARSKVIGGVVYRPFEHGKFAEIAFLAITSTEQVKGYGTRLMNKLKSHLQKQSIRFMLTYADNNAIGYFKKQGFSTVTRMPKHLWYGYIKDYDSGTLMDCQLNPEIDYENISSDLKRQKAALLNAVCQLYHLNIQKGLPFPPNKAKKFAFEDVKGLKESGWTLEEYKQSMRQEEKEPFYKQCKKILKAIGENSASWPFKKPVNTRDAPDYKEIVRCPMDLETVERKLEERVWYKSKAAFAKDLMLIASNAKAYNQPDTIYYKCAESIEECIKENLERLQEPSSLELQTLQIP
eukprot:TRINITY_DN9550_c0_g1_i10.p1 TRINITY_DN9550_c0_g1~~TRINITY_DN9550_c0_g1_i10.p1  ORF type:complete len:371 (+),score=108.58 TRINITY_DN9550_c0_g1_i10:213-1325(+)